MQSNAPGEHYENRLILGRLMSLSATYLQKSPIATTGETGYAA